MKAIILARVSTKEQEEGHWFGPSMILSRARRPEKLVTTVPLRAALYLRVSTARQAERA